MNMHHLRSSLFLVVSTWACVAFAAPARASEAPSNPAMLRRVSDLFLDRWASPAILTELLAAWQARRNALGETPAQASDTTECVVYGEALSRRQRGLTFAATEEARLITTRLPSGKCSTLSSGLVVASLVVDGDGHAVVDLAILSFLDHQLIAPRTAQLHHAGGSATLTIADPRSHLEMTTDELDLLSGSVLPDRGDAVGVERVDRVMIAAGLRLRTVRFISAEVIQEAPVAARFDGLFTVVGWDAPALAASIAACTPASLTRNVTQRGRERVAVSCFDRGELPVAWNLGASDPSCRMIPLTGVQLAVISGQRLEDRLVFNLMASTQRHQQGFLAAFSPEQQGVCLPEASRIIFVATGPKGSTGEVYEPTEVRIGVGPITLDLPPVYVPDAVGAFGPALFGEHGYLLDQERGELLIAVWPPRQLKSLSGRQKGGKDPKSASVSGHQKGGKF